jgi:hypothetical protein
MSPKQIEERIKFNTEIIKLLGLSILATVLGVVSLFYQSGASFGKTFAFGMMGMVIIGFQISLLSLLYRRNISLLKQIP